jgi:hypothetical protein
MDSTKSKQELISTTSNLGMMLKEKANSCPIVSKPFSTDKEYYCPVCNTYRNFVGKKDFYFCTQCKVVVAELPNNSRGDNIGY